MSHATHAFPIQAVTRKENCSSRSIGGAGLFSVRDGVPIAEALEKLTLLLSQAKAAAEACDEANNGNPLLRLQMPLTVDTLLEFSLALVDAINSGLLAHEKATGGA